MLTDSFSIKSQDTSTAIPVTTKEYKNSPPVACPPEASKEDEDCGENPDPPDPPEPPPDPVCGNQIVEDEEECDCGLTYSECSDPCCYPATLTEEDLKHNSTAKGCATHRQPLCETPYSSSYTYGLILPNIFFFLLVAIIGEIIEK